MNRGEEHSPWRMVCHGKPERCLVIGGKRLPLCARCFGTYSGIPLGILVSVIFLSAESISPTFLFILTLVALVPTAVDGTLQESTRWESSNLLRTLTGLLLGTVMGVDIWWILMNLG
ncbi:MAG: DUF2085 domain-containing protein [Thermoplasmatota archaeon]